jgi:tetratricopeptide (TPR) repeat protein
LVAVAVAVAIFVVDSPLDLEIRAWIYVKLDQPDLAANTYIRLTQVDPRNHKALEAIGDLYTVKGAHREAAAYYAKAVQLNRSVPNLLNAAISAQKAGLKEEALKCYQEVLALDPNNIVAKTNVKSVTPPKAVTALVPSPGPLEPAEKAPETQPQRSEPLSAPPEALGREREAQEGQVTKPEPSQKPVESSTPKGIPSCDHLLKDVKELIGLTEADKLTLFRERIGDPHRRCETETRKTYCFKCIVRGRLTDTIEIIEKDERIDSYYFGSCGCADNGVK